MTEDQHHIAVVDHYRTRGAHGWLMWHTPNGGHRNIQTARRLKKMGTMPGVPDLFVFGPDGVLRGLELKARGEKPSKAQDAFAEYMHRAGLIWDWSDDLDRSLSILEGWGALRRADRG